MRPYSMVVPRVQNRESPIPKVSGIYGSFIAMRNCFPVVSVFSEISRVNVILVV